MSPSTSLLVARFRTEQDPAALAELMARFEPRVQRIVRRRLGPGLRARLDSGDVVQEVLVESIRSLECFEPTNDRSLLRWLSGVVENKLRNLARKARREPLAHPAGSLVARLVGGDRVSDFDCQDQRHYEKELLAAGMELLAADQREVLELRNFAGLTFRRIGEQLGRTEAAVHALHRRAMAELVACVARLRRDGAAR